MMRTIASTALTAPNDKYDVDEKKMTKNKIKYKEENEEEEDDFF